MPSSFGAKSPAYLTRVGQGFQPETRASAERASCIARQELRPTF